MMLDSVTLTCAKALLKGHWSPEALQATLIPPTPTAAFYVGSIFKSSRLFAGLFCYRRISHALTNSRWANWAERRCLFISAILQLKLSFMRKTGTKHSVMPHLIFFFFGHNHLHQKRRVITLTVLHDAPSQEANAPARAAGVQSSHGASSKAPGYLKKASWCINVTCRAWSKVSPGGVSASLGLHFYRVTVICLSASCRH